MDPMSEKTTIVPSFVDDLFDLAAPSLEKPIVARLVPVISTSYQPIFIHQDDNVITVGRSKELQPPYRIDTSERISSKHCQFHVDGVTLGVTLKDISTNGTYINAKRLGKGVAVPLNSGDCVSLTKPEPPSRSNVDTRRRGSSVNSVEFLFQRIKEELTVDEVLHKLTCEICGLVYFRPFMVLPCMHVFCAPCISQRLREQRFACAVCHILVEEVRPTHNVESSVHQLLQAAPAYRRSAEEMRRLVELDEIPATGCVTHATHKRPRSEKNECTPIDDRRGSSSVSSSVARSDHFPTLIHPDAIFPGPYGHTSAKPDSECRHCQVPSSFDGFQCIEEGPHLTCQACRTRFPQRPLCDRPQRCHLCSVAFCNLYYKEEGGCPALKSTRLEKNKFLVGLCPLSAHVFSSIPPRALAGNVVEQDILTGYVLRHNITISEIWNECLEKLRKGKWTPDLTTLDAPITVAAPFCSRCAEAVFSSLIFIYRNHIPRQELPESVTDRPNCWEGINCHAQFESIEHAKRYNHVCYQVKRKE